MAHGSDPVWPHIVEIKELSQRTALVSCFVDCDSDALAFRVVNSFGGVMWLCRARSMIYRSHSLSGEDCMERVFPWLIENTVAGILISNQ